MVRGDISLVLVPGNNKEEKHIFSLSPRKTMMVPVLTMRRGLQIQLSEALLGFLRQTLGSLET